MSDLSGFMRSPNRWWIDETGGIQTCGVMDIPRWYCMAFELGGRAFRALEPMP